MPLSEQQRALLKTVLRERGLAPAKPSSEIARRESAEAPATDLQAGLWLLEQIDPQAGAYTVPSAARLSGPLSVGALERALDEIVRRHESLRTVFRSDGAQLQQVVRPHTRLQLECVDLSGLHESEREERARALVTESVYKPFALDRDLPFRVFLIRLAAEEHVLALNIHHIATDGYSMGVLTQELAALYGAFSQGRASPLTELPIQFGDYAAWHRERLVGETFERHAEYWRRALSPPLPALDLPTDKPRPRRLSGRGLHEQVHLPRDVTARLRSFSRMQGLTVFETLLGAFAVLLHFYSRQLHVIVGSPVANRSRTELEQLIGYFVNVLPFRIDLHGDPSFRELVQRVHEVGRRVYAHSEMAFGKVVELVQPVRDPSRNPIYQAELTLLEPRNTPAVYGYGFQSIGQQTLQLGDVLMSPYPVESGVSKFDITMLLWNLPEAIQGTLEYSTDLFEAATIRALAKRFVALLDRALASTEIRLSELCRVESSPPTLGKKIGAVKRRAVRVS